MLTCFLTCQRLEGELAYHFVLVELGTKLSQNSTGREPMIARAAIGSQFGGPGEVLGVVQSSVTSAKWPVREAVLSTEVEEGHISGEPSSLA